MRRLFFLLFCVFPFFSFCQVSLQSGSATFSMPIFQWKDNHSRLNMHVVLNYNSGNGLKVDAVASNIGQGWNLMAGGVISRMQASEPDDQVAYEGNGKPSDLTKYPCGFMYDSTSPEGISGTLKQYPIFKGKNNLYKQFNSVAVDKEFDQFMFQFNGKSGSFILGRKNFDIKPIFVNQNKMKLWFTEDFSMVNQGIRTTISEFYIQDEDGLIYKFSKTELTQILRTQYCNKKFAYKISQPKIKNDYVYYQKGFEDATIFRPYVVTSWYLTEIKDPFTQRKITIDYEVRDIANDGPISICAQLPKDYSTVSRSNSKTKTPVIRDIILPDGHRVDFNYGNERYDLIGDKILTSIDIRYQARFQTKWLFNSAYFILNRIGSPGNEEQKKNARLCLRSVKKLGTDLKDEELPYVFDYYTGSDNPDDFVPPPFYHLKDVWGFYNGSNSVAVNGTSQIPRNKQIYELNNSQLKGLCFMRSGSTPQYFNAKAGYSKNGLLKQINYPGGSTLKYVYEQNKGTISSQYIDVGGVHVSEIQRRDGCADPTEIKYKYVLSNSSTSSLWGLEQPDNKTIINNHYSPESKHWVYSVPFGKCVYRYQYPGIQSKDQVVSITSGQQILQIVGQIANIAGSLSTIYDVVNLCLISPGVGAIVAVVMDVISGVITLVQTCWTDHTEDNTYTSYFNMDFNSINPLPAQYKRVEVIENDGANGAKVYEFTSDQDYPVWFPTNEVHSLKQRYAYWAYGLPKKVTIYDAQGFSSGIPKVETENIYDFSETKKTPFCKFCGYGFKSYKALVLKVSSKRNDHWERDKDINGFITDMTSDPDMKVDGYNAYLGRTILTQTTQKIFKNGSGSEFLTTKNEYQYNSINLEVSQVKTTQTNGDIYYKNIKYNDDYTNTALNVLSSNNVFNVPVSEMSSFQKGGAGPWLYLNESVTEFEQLQNGNIVPYRKLINYLETPQTSMDYYDPNGANTSFHEVQKLYYDAQGNVIGMSDEGQRKITNIYDYDDQFIVAKIVNADPILDKSAYSSFETTSFGGWQLGGTPNYNHSLSVTGTTSFVMAGGNSFTAPLNTTKKYTVTFWATSTPSLTNAVLKESGHSVNGFIFYKYETNPGATQVVLTGAGNVDELRLYPVNARMETTTYDPLIGKTSECDVNNRITYFDYDPLGRLRFVKDEKKSVLKMMEYNVTDNGCPTVYTNYAVSEVFTKNNCGSGYEGSQVTYTIPANTYTSTVSQEMVDIQVQNDLDQNGQAYANTHGTCLQIYYNQSISQTFTDEACEDGYQGTDVTYTVPANKYTSTVSQADADAQALEDMEANGQVYANTNGTCTIDTDPYWEDTGTEECRSGHIWAFVKDVNPNSTTYNQTQWIDGGPNDACPAPTTIYAQIYYENIIDYTTERYADVIVKFYSDPARSIPISVNNLKIGYSVTVYDKDFYIYEEHQDYMYCTGTETTIAVQTLIYSEFGYDNYYITDYSLNPATYPIP